MVERKLYKNEVLEVISDSRTRISGLIRHSLDLSGTILGSVPCLGEDVIPQIRRDFYKKTVPVSIDEFKNLEQRGYRVI